MKRRLVLAALAVSIPTAALAGDDRRSCDMDRFGGEPSAEVSVQENGPKPVLACLIPEDRPGKAVPRMCFRSKAYTSPFEITDHSAAAPYCRREGGQGAASAEVSPVGATTPGCVVTAGQLSGDGNTLEPIASLGSGTWTNGKPGVDDPEAKDQQD